MEYLQDAPNICLSGGADGADLEWGRCATLLGHEVIHWSFHDHHSQAPPDTIIRLSEEQLAVGNEALRNAAAALGKHPPQRARISSLLQRNYYQVAWSQACYAVGWLVDSDDGGRWLAGGTGWATMMFKQLHPESRELYVFDQVGEGWSQWKGDLEGWVGIDVPPRPKGIWAGIGARELKQTARHAIGEVMCS